jgi:hypothetical protein
MQLVGHGALDSEQPVAKVGGCCAVLKYEYYTNAAEDNEKSVSQPSLTPQ